MVRIRAGPPGECVCVGYLPHWVLLQKHPNIHQNSSAEMKIRVLFSSDKAVFEVQVERERETEGEME